ncbi:MAG: ABC transporter permease subunit, partial [Chloroflexi bacterium]|nr:ABC transporter permease subunit [Chloroflexota bacterium]
LGPIFSPEGIINFDAWLSTEYINFWPVLLAVYAIFSAGGMVAREVERGTMDLLLSQPLPRYRVLITKFATILVGLCIIALFSMVGIYLGISIVNAQANEWGILLALVQGIFMLIAIASYSALFSCLFLSPRTTLTTSGVLTGASYIINVTATSLGPLSWTQKLSLFYYFRPLEVIHTSRLDGTGLGIYLAVSIVCLALALVIFERKDIVF